MALDLKILIEGDPNDFLDAIDKVKKESEDLDKVLSSVGKGAAIAFAAFSGAIVGSLVAFRDSEATVAQLNATLASTGRAADISSEAVQKLATKYQDLSTFGDEAIISGQTILLKFSQIRTQALEPATQAALDMATALHTDVASAATVVGKALNDPLQGLTLLKKQGVDFTQSQKDLVESLVKTGDVAGAQKIIFEGLGKAYGGSAQAAAGGLGSLIQLKEVIGDIVEGIGKEFAPAFATAGGVLKDLAIAVRDNETVIKVLARLLAAGAGIAGFIAAATLGALAVSKMTAAFEILQIALGATRIQLALTLGAATLGIGLVLAFLPEIIAFAKNMVNAFTAAKDSLIKLFSDLFSNIGAIIVNYVKFYASLFDWKKILTGDLSGIKDAAKALGASVDKALTDTFKDTKKVTQDVQVGFNANAKGAEDQAKAKADADKKAADAAKKAADEQAKLDAETAAKAAEETKRHTNLLAAEEETRKQILTLKRKGASDEAVKIKQDELALIKSLDEAKGETERKIAEQDLINFRKTAGEKLDFALQKDKEHTQLAGQEADLRNEIVTLKTKGGSDEVVKVKQQELELIKAIEEAKTAEEMAIAEQNLANFTAVEDQKIAIAQEKDLEKNNKQIESMLAAAENRRAVQAEIDALDEEDRLLLEEKDFANLDATQLRRREALMNYATAEAAEKKKANDAKLADEIKYGSAYAAIQAAMNSQAVKGTEQATGQLVQLQQSRNSTLKGIGKAAALVQIGIDTAKSAMSIYSGFATIPIVGPALGVAGAAAAIAFGLEKMNQVRSAATGGIVPGVGSGDTQPFMLEPGEVVVPKALAPTFAEEFGGLTADPNSPARKSQVTINTVIGTEEYVRSNIIPAIKDATELDNARIGVG